MSLKLTKVSWRVAIFLALERSDAAARVSGDDRDRRVVLGPDHFGLPALLVLAPGELLKLGAIERAW